MKFHIYIFLIIILAASDISGAEPEGFDAGYRSLSASDFSRHLNFLGSDLFEGRGTGQMGGNLAAKYLALELDRIGLVPMGSENTFYQYVPMHGSYPLRGSKMKLLMNGGSRDMELWRDYLIYRSAGQVYFPNPKQLVFAGYGIIAPEYDYNDYHSIDVAGKIVVMLGGEPHADDPDYFSGQKRTIYSHPDTKLRLALSLGADGSIIIPDPDEYEFLKWDEMRYDYAFEDVSLAYAVNAHLSVLINPVAANQLFAGSQYSLKDIFEMHERGAIESFPLETSLTFDGEFRERDFVSPNIIGMIRGSKFPDSYVLVSAHYDHLGIGPPVEGDSIYNGVMDNAAGCAALLCLARAFSLPEVRPQRSILFVLTTGEEKGALGAKYYTDHPVAPLHKTIANVNIDGIALFHKFRSIVAIGAGLTNLDSLLEDVARRNNLEITGIPAGFEQQESFAFSDQLAFAREGIPSIMIYEGPDYSDMTREEGLYKLINYSRNIYHTPFDDLSQPLNYEAALQHVRLLYEYIYKLANSDIAPRWYPGAIYRNARLRNNAEGK
ncbi:MAG: M28 family peptidase [Candidatus Kapaibacterium sp.]